MRTAFPAIAALVGLVGCASGPNPNPDPAPVASRPPGVDLASAIRESIPILAVSDPVVAAGWRTWLEAHPDPRPEDLRPATDHAISARRFPGVFLATAYAAPILDATRIRDRRNATPILSTPSHRIPAEDLPTRREIAEDPSIAPPAIGWIENALDAYLAEVNGSVALRFDDGEVVCLAWARTNERSYTSLGRRLVEEGLAPADGMDLAVIRDRHDSNPDRVEALMLDNDRVVFFEPIPADRWPRASTGARLVPRHAAAVDPEVVVPGSVLLVEGPGLGRLVVVAVDTGGAIKGRRIDLFLGAGRSALAEAGAVVEEVSVSVLEPVPVP